MKKVCETEIIDLRAITLAEYIISRKATVREAAKHFSISKSTVHKDVTTRLRRLNFPLFCSVNEVLQLNKSQRHLRGGNATKEKYSKTK